VLVVDDHPLFRQGTVAALQHYDDIDVVGSVATGQEALRFCASQPPDVVLLDLNLPDMSGIQAARTLTESNPSIRVIALTAHDDDAFVNALTDAGGRGYLLKSATDHELASAVRSVAAGRSVFDPAVTDALLRRARGETDQNRARLTERELAVLQLAADGMTNRQIGRELGVSERTVQAHLSHIFGKLDVSSRTEASMAALREGLIDFDSGPRT
jgi:DNA-binding NarL/FixJ family response regulator